MKVCFGTALSHALSTKFSQILFIIDRATKCVRLLSIDEMELLHSAIKNLSEYLQTISVAHLPRENLFLYIKLILLCVSLSDLSLLLQRDACLLWVGMMLHLQ